MQYKDKLINNYELSIRTFLENIYSSAYNEGFSDGKAKSVKMRTLCSRIPGEHDSEYQKNWNDDGPFNGWCSECGRPHSGRWAYAWEYCPWCGGPIRHVTDDPGQDADSEDIPKENVCVQKSDDTAPDAFDTDDSSVPAMNYNPEPVINQLMQSSTFSQRDMIRAELNAAIAERRSMFEFVNDAYRYESLASNVRNTLRTWWKKDIFFPATVRVRQRLNKEGKSHLSIPPVFSYERNVYTVTQKNLEDRVHVYCTLNLDIIDKIDRILYEEVIGNADCSTRDK